MFADCKMRASRLRLFDEEITTVWPLQKKKTFNSIASMDFLAGLVETFRMWIMWYVIPMP